MPEQHSSFSAPPSRAAQDGYTLLEVLIATALLLTIAVGVVPLFSRSIQSNLIGSRASEMTAFAATDIEGVNQKVVDHEDWDLDAGVCNGETCVELPTQFWRVPLDPGARNLGDERWVDDETANWRKQRDGQFTFVWQRKTTVRKYTYADVIPGNIDITGTKLVPVGHPELFDVPLTNDDGPDASSAHLVEVRIGLQLNDTEVLDDLGQRMNVGHFRAY